MGFTTGGSRTCSRGCDTLCPPPLGLPSVLTGGPSAVQKRDTPIAHPPTSFRDPWVLTQRWLWVQKRPRAVPAAVAAPGSPSCLGFLSAPTFPGLRGLSPSSGGSWTPDPGSWHGTGLSRAGLPGLAWDSWAGLGIPVPLPASSGVTQVTQVTQAGGTGACRGLALRALCT